jgi:hypothetical protein
VLDFWHSGKHLALGEFDFSRSAVAASPASAMPMYMALDVVYVQRPVGDYAIAIAVPQSLLQYLLVTLKKKIIHNTEQSRTS